jgi:hypothetical protein
VETNSDEFAGELVGNEIISKFRSVNHR